HQGLQLGIDAARRRLLAEHARHLLAAHGAGALARLVVHRRRIVGKDGEHVSLRIAHRSDPFSSRAVISETVRSMSLTNWSAWRRRSPSRRSSSLRRGGFESAFSATDLSSAAKSSSSERSTPSSWPRKKMKERR